MTVKIDPDLYFVTDEVCESCPVYLYDKMTSTWRKTSAKPTTGDHVVLDFTIEKVVIGLASDGKVAYRSLNARYDQRLWYGSIPDSLPIADVRLREVFSSEYNDDPSLFHRVKNHKALRVKIA